MAIILSTDYVTQLALSRLDQFIKRKGGAIKANRMGHAFLSWVESIKKVKPFGASVTETLKREVKPTGTSWSGDATFGSAGSTRDLVQVQFSPFNYVEFEKIIRDELNSAGIYLKPASYFADTKQRVLLDTKDDFTKVENMLDGRIESVMNKMVQALAWQYLGLQQGANDCAGLFVQFPLTMSGTFGGINRTANPFVQHFLAIGASGNNAGSEHIKPTVVGGAPGTTTFWATVKGMMRRAKGYLAQSGLGDGEWRCFGGGAALDSLELIYRQAGITWNADAAKAGKSQAVDLSLGDEDLKVFKIPPWYEPDFLVADALFPSLKPQGVSQITCTFSGGGSPTRQGKAIAYVTAAGALSSVCITDPGEGYTSAPTLTLGNVGSGTGATVQPKVYTTAASSSSNVQVTADDNRIGTLDSVTVTAAGSGYPVPATVNFDNLLVFVAEQAWEVMVPSKSLDRELVWVPDGRQPNSEFQIHHRGLIKCNCPKAVIMVAMP